MKQSIVFFTALFGLLGFAILPVQAALISTPDVIESQQLQLDHTALLALLQREEMQEQLFELGVIAEQVEQRVSKMTDIEVAQLNKQIEDLPAGGVVGAVIVVFIVFVITDAIGATDIFPFIRPVN